MADTRGHLGVLRDEYRTPPGEDPTAAGARFEAELNRIGGRRPGWVAVWRLVAMRAEDDYRKGRPWTWDHALNVARQYVRKADGHD